VAEQVSLMETAQVIWLLNEKWTMLN